MVRGWKEKDGFAYSPFFLRPPPARFRFTPPDVVTSQVDPFVGVFEDDEHSDEMPFDFSTFGVVGGVTKQKNIQ